MGELERKSWYMVATDSGTLLKELSRQSAISDPRDAGLDTWSLLMNMIGRGETAEESKGDFDDLMLKEWARDKLLEGEDVDDDYGAGAGFRITPAAAPPSSAEGTTKEKEGGGGGRFDALGRLVDRFTGKASSSSSSDPSSGSGEIKTTALEAAIIGEGSLVRASS